VPYHEKKLGQLFCDNKSSDILDMLLNECDQVGVSLHLDTSIETIEKLESGYLLQTTLGQFACQSLVIATGGLSIPTLGATGFGYQVASQFGHELLPTRAGLVPFTITDQLKELCTELSGTSVDCLVSCNDQSFRENILFTHRGLSGPAILQISSFWEAGDTVEINLLPDDDAAWLQQQQAERPNSELKTLLGEIFTKKMANLLADNWFVSKPMKQYTHASGRHRRETGELASGAGRHRRLSHRRSDPGRRGYPRGVVQDHGIAEKPWAVLHRRSAGRDRAPGRFQLPVGLGVGLRGGAVRLRVST
jgi:predicted Rossmann fold flavoprotein